MPEIKDPSILNRAELQDKISHLRQQNKRIVATNGCFDILHIGHLSLLKQAKSFADILIVGINSDNSVKILKGPDRPVINEIERAQIIAALKVVDFVSIFEEKTAVELLKVIKPDVYVKGGDYTIADLPESEPVIASGGIVKIIPFVPFKSTTSLIEKIKNLS